MHQVYHLGSMSAGVSSALKQGLAVMAGLRTGKVQHNRLLHSILRAPMEFFDRTPLGRILNRFSSDVATIDDELPHLFMWFLVMVLDVLGSVALVGFITPWALVAFLVLGLIFGWIQVPLTDFITEPTV